MERRHPVMGKETGENMPKWIGITAVEEDKPGILGRRNDGVDHLPTLRLCDDKESA